MSNLWKINILVGLLLLIFPISVYAEQTEEQMQTTTEYPIKVLSLNIHSAVNWDGEYDLDGLTQFIQEVNPDIIGLQEVDRSWSSRSRFQDICLELATRLNLNYGFSVSLEKNASYYGNQILSKFPIVQIWSEKLPGSLEVRSFVFTQLWVNGIRINVLNTHLGLSVEDRILQTAEIRRFLSQVNGPVIVMGDFNGVSSDQSIGSLVNDFIDLRELSDFRNQGTFRMKDGSVGSRIDYILTSPDFLYQSFQIVENKISDHLPLVAEVSLLVDFENIAGEPVFEQNPL